MYFGSAFPFVRITIFFISGILWAYYRPLSYQMVVGGMVILGICYLILVIVLQRTKLYSLNSWLGVAGLASVCLSGTLCVLNYKNSDIPAAQFHNQLPDIEAYIAVALEDATKKEDRLALTVAIQQVRMQGKWKKITRKVRLSLYKPYMAKLQYGEVYMILGRPKLIPLPLNPEEFNYKAFLSHENICYHHLVTQGAIQRLAYAPSSHLQELFFKIRRFCKDTLERHIVGARECGIILALVLGIKDELDLEMRDAYASAGTMHVLAVSGLHVGILYWLLSLLLYSYKKTRSMRWLCAIFVLLGLWMYAGITGLAPSVLRATLMFSFVVLAMLLGRASNIYNVLAASAFLLLLCNPLLIFSVSFQLSYLAVLGIVYLQPKIYAWIGFKNLILRQLWMWTSVSLAAQLATTPISLYYFHQFSTYFVLANWVVVPAAFFIFILGLGVLFTCWCSSLNSCIGWLLEHVTWVINQFVVWISSLPYSVLEDIYMSKQNVWLWYGFILSVLVCLGRKSFPMLLVTGSFVLFLGIRTIQAVIEYHFQQGVIVYSIPAHQAVGFFKGKQCIILVDEQLSKHDKKFTYHIKPSQLAMGFRTTDSYTFRQALDMSEIPLADLDGIKIAVWGQKKFAFIDNPAMNWPILNQKVWIDFLIIEENSVKSLKHLLAQFEFGALIIGASNTKQLAKRLKDEADGLQLNSHSLHHQGAFRFCW